MYTVKENVSKEAIEEFLQSRKLTLDVPYQFSLGLFENSRLQGVLLYEDSLWESKVLQKKVMNVKLLAANSTGQLKSCLKLFILYAKWMKRILSLSVFRLKISEPRM